MSISETISPEEIEQVILDNQDMMTERQEYFSVNRDELNQIYEKVNNCNSLGQEIRKRIISKAAYIISLISNWQPFQDGNRESSFSHAMQFLRRNNFNLPINSVEEQRTIFNLIDKTKDKSKSDPTLCTEIESFLSERVVDYGRTFYY